jgi:hypothetical protein
MEKRLLRNLVQTQVSFCLCFSCHALFCCRFRFQTRAKCVLEVEIEGTNTLTERFDYFSERSFFSRII